MQSPRGCFPLKFHRCCFPDLPLGDALATCTYISYTATNEYDSLPLCWSLLIMLGDLQITSFPDPPVVTPVLGEIRKHSSPKVWKERGEEELLELQNWVGANQALVAKNVWERSAEEVRTMKWFIMVTLLLSLEVRSLCPCLQSVGPQV